MKRKAKFILWISNENKEIYIGEDSKTLLSDLDKLPHFYGIYESYELAYIKARSLLQYRIEQAEQNLKRLKKGRKK